MKLKYLFLPFLFCACAENEWVEPSSPADVVPEISISSPTITFTGLEETRGYFNETVSGTSRSYTYYFQNDDHFGLFPDNGYQVGFDVSGLTAEGSNRVAIDAKGWRTKSGITYACYFPYNLENTDKNAIPFSYLGQKQSGNHNYRHLDDYVFLVSDPTTDENGTAIFDFETREIGATAFFNFAVPDVSKTYTKVELYLPNQEFTVAGTVNLFPTSGEGRITPTQTSNVVSLDLGDGIQADQNGRVGVYFRLAPMNISAQELHFRLYTADGALYERVVASYSKNFEANKGYGTSVSNSDWEEVDMRDNDDQYFMLESTSDEDWNYIVLFDETDIRGGRTRSLLSENEFYISYNGKDWKRWIADPDNYNSRSLYLDAGEKVYIKGNFPNGLDGYRFNTTSNVKAYGNIMSLIYGDDFKDKKTIPAAYCFNNLFNDCSYLEKAPALPATELAEDCYRNMFSGCTSLTQAPVLPARHIDKTRCYYYMFYGCSSLTSVEAHIESVSVDFALFSWLDRTADTGVLNLPYYYDQVMYGKVDAPNNWEVVQGSGVPVGSADKNHFNAFGSQEGEYIWTK